jgi:aminopeptidase
VPDGVVSGLVEPQQLEAYARLIVDFGANVQAGQRVLVIAAPEAAPLVRAVARACYRRGALFVDPWYFDAQVKRVRAERADPETLELVPSWYPTRLLELSEAHGCRISIVPSVPPGLMDGLDPALAGRDQLPMLAENFDVINAKTTNWLVVPWATPDWARVVHPGLPEEEANARLEEQLRFVLRLDTDDPEEAWRERLGTLHGVAQRIDAHRFDTLHLEGPGTDLTVGLLPTSRFAEDQVGTTTVDGVVHHPNLPTEEIFTAPDPERTTGVVAATRPLDLSGTVVRGLRIRFERGTVVSIDADEGAEALRARCAKDAGASRLGELALVDRDGLIGRTRTTFFNTLLDENAASHLALGNGYETTVGEADRERVNSSAIHVDFMVGSDEVSVTGTTRSGERLAVLRGGVWQV